MLADHLISPTRVTVWARSSHILNCIVNILEETKCYTILSYLIYFILTRYIWSAHCFSLYWQYHMLLSVKQDLMLMSVLHVGLCLSETLFSLVNALVQAACPAVYIKVSIHTIFFKHVSRSVEAELQVPTWSAERLFSSVKQSSTSERSPVLIRKRCKCKTVDHFSLCFGETNRIWDKS